MICYTKKQKLQIVKLRKLGHTYKNIANLVGINNLTTIHNICRDAGLKQDIRKPKIVYAAGQRYNNFVLLKKRTSQKLKSGDNISRWECLCDCGRLFIITTKQISRGQKSCGCLSSTGPLNTKSSQEIIMNTRFVVYKNGAKNRKLCWDLSKEQFEKLLFGNCNYCKSEPLTLVVVKNRSTMVNGVDRVDNNIGYIESNCVSCCKFCNRAKSNMSFDDWKSWLLLVKNKK